MKKIGKLTLAASLVCGMIGCTGSDSKNSEEPENAFNGIEGKWKIVHYEKSGSKRSSSLVIVDEIVGNKWIRPKRKTSVYTLKLNPQSIPKEVDLSTQRLGDKSLKGIYKVEGEKLFFCYAYDPKLARPKDFKTEAGDNCYLYELKKVGN